MRIRPWREDDREAIVDLLEAARRNGEAAAFRERREPHGPGVTVWIAETDRPVGLARLVHDRYDPAGVFDLELAVHPDARLRGAGKALWEALPETSEIRTSVRDDDPAALAFAERRGFARTGHLFESFLDLEGFDATAHPMPEGVRVFSMADVPDDETHRRKLWRLNDWDLEAGAGACRPFEQFERDIFGGYWYRPEGQIVAAIEDEWVGLAAVGITGEAKGYNMMTGVVPAFRRRGIATALKLATIVWAKAQGARQIWTHNAAENAPMLSINRKLGYQPVPGHFRLARKR